MPTQLPLCSSLTVWGSTPTPSPTSLTNRRSEMPRAAASSSFSSKRPRCATPPPDAPGAPTCPPQPRPRPRPATQPVPRPSPRPSAACPQRALKHRLQHRHLAHARAPRAAARSAALERACERPWLAPRPADAAAPGHGAVGRVCEACESALQGLAGCARLIIGRAALRGHPRQHDNTPCT